MDTPACKDGVPEQKLRGMCLFRVGDMSLFCYGRELFDMTGIGGLCVFLRVLSER